MRLVVSAIFFQFVFTSSLQIVFADQSSQNFSKLISMNLNESSKSIDWIDEAGAHITGAQDNFVLGANKWPNNSIYRIVVIGDSIAWGDGLNRDEKYYYKVADWLQEWLKKPVWVTVYAHSGATLSPPNGGANITRKFTNPDLSSWDPTISEQVNHISDPENVDLILVSGGINDVNVNTILNPLTTPDDIRTLCNNMQVALETILKKLLNNCTGSKIIVTSYYPIVSNDTSEYALNVFADALQSLDPDGIEGKGFNIIKNIYGVKNTLYILSNNSRVFDNQSRLSLNNAIELANQYSVSRFGKKRVAFAPVDFPSNRSYGTNGSWLWELNDPRTNNGTLINDHRYNYRISLCNMTLCGPTDKISAIGHPNVEGADEYNQTIINTILKMV